MNYDLELLDTYSQILIDLVKNQPNILEVAIAGGALRDMLLEKPIKDIDIFYIGSLDEENLYKVFKKPDGDLEVVEKTYPESTFKVPYQELYYKDVKLPIQLIKVEAKDSILTWIRNDFGCNLSMVLMGPYGDLILTKEFIQDATLSILTFKNECDSKYAQKLIDKYPEYSCNGLGSNYLLDW